MSAGYVKSFFANKFALSIYFLCVDLVMLVTEPLFSLRQIFEIGVFVEI